MLYGGHLLRQLLNCVLLKISACYFKGPLHQIYHKKRAQPVSCANLTRWTVFWVFWAEDMQSALQLQSAPAWCAKHRIRTHGKIGLCIVEGVMCAVPGYAHHLSGSEVCVLGDANVRKDHRQRNSPCCNHWPALLNLGLRIKNWSMFGLFLIQSLTWVNKTQTNMCVHSSWTERRPGQTPELEQVVPSGRQVVLPPASSKVYFVHRPVIFNVDFTWMLERLLKAFFGSCSR